MSDELPRSYNEYLKCKLSGMGGFLKSTYFHNRGSIDDMIYYLSRNEWIFQENLVEVSMDSDRIVISDDSFNLNIYNGHHYKSLYKIAKRCINKDKKSFIEKIIDSIIGLRKYL